MLFRVVDYVDYKKQQKLLKLKMQDQYIEREYQRLKAESVAKAQSVMVKPSSQIGRSMKFDRESSKVGPEVSHKDRPEADEESLTQIIEPIKPKTKTQLLAKSSSSSLGTKVRIRSDYGRKSAERVLEGNTTRGKSRGSQGSVESKRKSSKHSGKSGKSGKYGKVSTVDEQNLTGVDLSNQLIQMQSESEFHRPSRKSSKERANEIGHD